MIDQTKYLNQFLRLYWNQSGNLVYGTIEKAFRAFLSDCQRLPDKGSQIIRYLYRELDFIFNNDDYAKWIDGPKDTSSIKMVGGRFIWPDEIGTLIKILNDHNENLDS